ncbi:hypothetical protein MUO14_01285 [Halobacillus shinanisalinarum]|uniref:Uncharacterized protein n=1 Tax=Halobacillus shinanisalinarum TaxID=2932258 RepID=A0ABY4GZP7_9BACI|nr:hypothetical protein [Halobacillus shinanisalinarum]UOQ93670.1 hypothetical protein MUO14_01285 [Halobacillus shinanisalinarum]
MAFVNHSKPYLQWLDRPIERFGFDVEAMGLHDGYLTLIAHRRYQTGKGFLAMEI